jgi:outer membrane protein assembly factor BamE (lipoprotein component of BamABCDE complex)
MNGRLIMKDHGLRALLLTTVCLLPGCIVFHDQAGVPVDQSMANAITEGMPRERVLEVVGSPTGTFSTKLLSLITGFGDTFDETETQGRRDDDVLTWQQVEVHATTAFFPVLFAWAKSRVHSRTLMVIFDEQGLVTKVAYREDKPE